MTSGANIPAMKNEDTEPLNQKKTALFSLSPVLEVQSFLAALTEQLAAFVNVQFDSASFIS